MSPSRLKPDVRPEVGELSLLYELGRLLEQHVDLRAAAQPVLRALAQHTALRAAVLRLADPEHPDAPIEARHGLALPRRAAGAGGTDVAPVSRSGEAAHRGRDARATGALDPALIDAVHEQVQHSGKPAALGADDVPRPLPHGGRALDKADLRWLAVPVKTPAGIAGVLGADRLFGPERPWQEDLRLLGLIAAAVAQALHLRRAAQADAARLAAENLRLQEALETRFRPANLLGNSRSMQAVYALMAQVAARDTTVLIRGASGTGKELVAHALHYNSPRAKKPFIRVNCAALPESVIESELFGHEAGAFTGAVATRKGRFELAHEGTLFLDEVGDFSPATQVRLLRVLQEREFERVGGSQTLRVNVRVLAATNRDLEALVATEKFRPDLYYRLNVFPLHLPPLRERAGDLLLLADHFCEKYSRAMDQRVRRISTPAIDMLLAYHWPGNVRELENCIERAVLLSTDGVIHGWQLPPTLQTAVASRTAPKGRLQEALETVEREMIVEALKVARGNGAQAAEALGITERIMRLRMKKHGIDWRRFRTHT